MTNKDKGQSFAGGGDPQANQHASHFEHGAGGDVEEAVELGPLDKSCPAFPVQSDVIHGHDPGRELARGDLPHAVPADAKRDTSFEVVSNNDRMHVGQSQGYFSGPSGERGTGEVDWRTPGLGGNAEGPSREEAVGSMPGYRDAPELRGGRRDWQELIPTGGRNDRTPESKTPSRPMREDK